jgi:hypothetical protein
MLYVFHLWLSLLENALSPLKSLFCTTKKVGFALAKAILGKVRKLMKTRKVLASFFCLRRIKGKKKTYFFLRALSDKE